MMLLLLAGFSLSVSGSPNGSIYSLRTWIVRTRLALLRSDLHGHAQ